MPIQIPNDLPAFAALEAEKIFVMPDDRAEHQDIRALKIAIVNLMPNKVTTETQLLRLLSNTPLHVMIDLVQMSSHTPKNTPQEHMLKFYKPFDEIKRGRYDGLIITGAPVEQLEFEDVDYWEELCRIFEWSKTNVYSTIHICWGAQAGLYYHYGIGKHILPEKMSGVFLHNTLDTSHPLLRGFGDTFFCPHSRHTGINEDEVEKVPELTVLARSKEAGIHIISDSTRRQFFLLGHWEYDRETLAGEYTRDMGKGMNPKKPKHYFPHGDVTAVPRFNWSCSANLMYANWLNYCVYQETPYELEYLIPIEHKKR
ncbi:MAG: homoserine O-succinyltransferase [Ruminococcus sp.]|nr:homoserine O-succinyltransferase [Ruminococcus sp.]